MVSTRQTRIRAAAAKLRPATAALLVGLLVVTAPLAAAAATLDASVDREVVHEGDTVRLTLRAGDAKLPDLSPLAADFEVLGTQQSQSLTIVNGRPESSRSLQVLLSPRRSGELTIPALRAGDAVSEPIRVSVLDGASAVPAPAAAGRAAAPRAGDEDAPGLFVEATTDEASPFVQGEVRYTVRVYDAIGMREGALTEPGADGVRFEPLGDTRTYEKELNGRRYRVHERQYALFPQTSGPVTIPPLVLQARVPDPDRAPRGAAAAGAFGDDFFADGVPANDVMAEMLARMRAAGMRTPFGGSLFDRMMSPGREVRVRSNAVTLNVAARPADAPDGWFLPARAVELSESFSPSSTRFQVGEAVERRVVLRAAGASAEQLPKLEVASVEGIRQYARNPEERTLPTPDGVVSEVAQTFELVPTAPGTFTLPAVEVAWWDVDAGVARTATLAARTVEVLPAAGGRATTSAAAAAAAPAGAAGASRPAPADAAPAREADAAATTSDPSVMLAPLPIAIGAGAVTLLVVAAAWWVVRRTRRPDHPSAGARDASRTAPASSARALVDALRQACAARNARAVRDALLAWGRATWPGSPPASTSAVAQRLGHPGFAAAVKMLDDSLYAPQTVSLDGDRLWREFCSARKSRSARTAEAPEPLPTLYPSSRVV